MKIRRIEFSNYRSLKSESLNIDASATVLIGSNDVGKSNILRGIVTFGQRAAFGDDDFCRHRDHQNAQPKITVHYADFTESDQKLVGQILLRNGEITTLEIAREGNDPEGYSIKLNGETVDIEDLRSRWLVVESDEEASEEQATPEPEAPPLTEEPVNSEQAEIENETPDEAETPEEQPNSATIEEEILFRQELIEAIWELLPQVEFYQQPPDLVRDVTLDQLRGDEPQFMTARKLLELAGVEDYGGLVSAIDPVGARDVRGDIERRMTEILQEYWNQDRDLSIGLTELQGKLVFSFGEATPRETYPEQHSEATQSYIAILVDCLTRIGLGSKDALLLMDEPGKRLHPGGQKDLLQLFRALSRKHQIIYTAHFPYLIDKNYPSQLRLIEKSSVGTIIIDKAHYAPDPYDLSYEPVRTALGVGMGDSLAFNEKNIIVEGPADQLIISGISQEMAIAELEKHIDLNKTAFVPAGSAGNIGLVGKMARAKNRKAIGLFDSDDPGKTEYDKLMDKAKKHPDSGDLLSQNELVTLAHVYATGDRTQRATEDLIPANIYFEAINQLYRRIYPADWDDISPSEERFKDDQTTVAKRVEKYFEDQKKSGDYDFGDFDKVRTASEVVRILRETEIFKDGKPKRNFEKIVDLVGYLRDVLDEIIDPSAQEEAEPVEEEVDEELEENSSNQEGK